MFIFVEFGSFRIRYCQQYYFVSCKECYVLIEIVNYIQDKGIVKVLDLYYKFFFSNKYKLDKVVRRLFYLLVVIFVFERFLGF